MFVKRSESEEKNKNVLSLYHMWKALGWQWRGEANLLGKQHCKSVNTLDLIGKHAYLDQEGIGRAGENLGMECFAGG